MTQSKGKAEARRNESMRETGKKERSKLSVDERKFAAKADELGARHTAGCPGPAATIVGSAGAHRLVLHGATTSSSAGWEEAGDSGARPACFTRC